MKNPVPGKTLDNSGNPPTGYTEQLFGVCNFLVALIIFVIVAFVIFLIVRITKKCGMD